MWKHLTDGEGKQEAPELTFECHSKGCKYLCTCYILFYTFNKFIRMLCQLLSHYGVLCVKF